MRHVFEILKLQRSAEKRSSSRQVTAKENGVETPLVWAASGLRMSLALALGTLPEIWLDLQAQYDLAKHRPERKVKLHPRCLSKKTA